MANLHEPRWCGRYAGGHDVHPIQAICSAPDREPRERVLATVAGVSPDGIMRVENERGLHLVWNHNPHRLAAFLDHYGNKVAFQPDWALLFVPWTGGACFSVRPAKELERANCLLYTLGKRL